MDSVVTHDRVVSGTTHVPNHEIMYVRDEQQYDTSFDRDCGFTYSLEAQVHSVNASSQAMRYFTTLALSTTGSAFTQVMFQIDTVATCNTMSLSTLR